MASPFTPKVSIVIPVYNGSNYMREAIDSALAQTYPNIEVVVVNDGSTDGGETEMIAHSYGERIRYFKKENGGVASALNCGIANMTGDYFSWLSHDDMYTPEKVQSQVDALSKTSNKTTVVACGFRVVDASCKELFIVDPLHLMYPKEELERPLFALLRSCIHGCGLLIHRSHFERVGVFREDLPTTQDYELWFRMMRKRPLIFSDGLYVLSRSHEKQDSKRLAEVHIPECNQLWRDMIDTMDEEDMRLMDGSALQFYENTWHMLRDITPYRGAEEYVKKLYEKELQKSQLSWLGRLWLMLRRGYRPE